MPRGTRRARQRFFAYLLRGCVRLRALREYERHQRPLVDLRARPPAYPDELLVVKVEVPPLDVSVDGVVDPPAGELPLEEALQLLPRDPPLLGVDERDRRGEDREVVDPEPRGLRLAERR